MNIIHLVGPIYFSSSGKLYFSGRYRYYTKYGISVWEIFVHIAVQLIDLVLNLRSQLRSSPPNFEIRNFSYQGNGVGRSVIDSCGRG